MLKLIMCKSVPMSSEVQATIIEVLQNMLDINKEAWRHFEDDTVLGAEQARIKKALHCMNTHKIGGR